MSRFFGHLHRPWSSCCAEGTSYVSRFDDPRAYPVSAEATDLLSSLPVTSSTAPPPSSCPTRAARRSCGAPARHDQLLRRRPLSSTRRTIERNVSRRQRAHRLRELRARRPRVHGCSLGGVVSIRSRGPNDRCLRAPVGAPPSKLCLAYTLQWALERGGHRHHPGGAEPAARRRRDHAAVPRRASGAANDGRPPRSAPHTRLLRGDALDVSFGDRLEAVRTSLGRNLELGACAEAHVRRARSTARPGALLRSGRTTSSSARSRAGPVVVGVCARWTQARPVAR